MFGILAKKYGYVEIELSVCKSNNGYFIGTMDHCGPVSRESEEYYKTEVEASLALAKNSFTQRQWP